LFIDEEPLDPRIIVTKIITHFSKTGIQSISFGKGLKKTIFGCFWIFLPPLINTLMPAK